MIEASNDRPKALRIGRRAVLAAAAAWLTPNSSMAQTLIDGSPSSGEGWRPPVQVGGPVREGSVMEIVARAPAPPRDWRDMLLDGERSVVMGRGSAARRYRYRTQDGLVDTSGYAGACFVLRDVQVNRMVAMDTRLLDVLCGIQRWLEFNGRTSTIQVTSGFRSSQTNGATEGSARNSMHLYGRAADIIIEGASSGLVGAMVKQFNSNGGTGVYLARGFVHVDTGAARTWISTDRAGRR
jgi:uncharacterized protein YcbK (DUF882 family)